MSDFEFWRLLLVPTKTRHQSMPFCRGKAVQTLNEVQVYPWEQVLLEGFFGSLRECGGMLSDCFSLRWLCCGSL